MKDKKHIDRLFQERFKDFEATPDASVWDAIEDTLQHKKKKKRRVIPIWWRGAGIAAGIALLLTIGNLVFNTDDNDNASNNQVVTTKEIITPNTNASNSENTNSSQNNDAQKTVSEEIKLENEDEKLNGIKKSNYVSNPDQSNQFVNASKSTTTKSTPSINKINHKTSIAASIATEKESLTNVVKNNLLPSKNSSNEVVSQESIKESEKNTINSINTSKADTLIKETKQNTSGTVVSIESKDDTTTNTSEDFIKKEAIEEEKPSILDEIASVEEKVADQETAKNKWNVMPNIAPVYFNTLGNGSSIHSQFRNNDKSGQVNMSYGVAASYNVTEKLSIRSGINKVKVGYNTNDVLIYQGINTATSATSAISGTGRSLETINYSNNTETITIVTAANLEFSDVPDVVTNTIDASLDQSLGFIEVPLELSYKISDKKLGLSVIGGMSALFLSDNEVYSTLNGNKTLLGEANNIRNTSFTTNIGLGLDYKISEKIDINLEPVFKYHMNTFESKSGDFKPYTIGVYTGFSFKF